ncbi:MAG: ABC transporter ATP-binding protein [Acidobacteria bacterium]|nr:MAG: ABC transporter ATP-binding protein [Acidobacteriota bacterium]
MIELRSLCRTYRMGSEDVHALNNVTLNIKKGEHIAVVGPSGSGKSTLLNILGCLDRPTSGSYRFSGKEVGDLGEVELSGLRQRWIGFVFQFFHLLPRLDAVGNVEVPMLFAGVEKEQRRQRSRRALEAVGLGHRLRHKPEELSGGERQRVAIARSVVMGPRLLLADEPTGNLDRHSAEEIMDLIEQMNAEGLTLIVVTHDPAIAKRAGRIIRLEDGRVIEGGVDLQPES